MKLDINLSKKINKINSNKKTIGLLINLFLLIIVSSTLPVYAHGTYIEYKADISYSIVAKYDNGEPMSNAQVIVYAPNNPDVPYTTGTCDENGKYIFLPDNSIEGSWFIQVREGGHGASVHIPVGDSNSYNGNTGYTILQKILMVLCVAWGCIGTALFFKRRKGYAHS